MRHSLFIAALCLTFYSFAPTSGKLKVSSIAFGNNQMIPLKYSCEGENISPPLHISGIPAGTVTLAIIMHDPDAPIEGGFTHWVTWNLDAVPDIPENLTAGNQGMNGRKMKGYTGMCPPTGAHRYYFLVYALDTKLNIEGYVDKTTLEEAMKGHTLAQGKLMGLYEKKGKTPD